MLSGLKQSAASAARKAGFLTGGLLCISVGAAFLTVAAWITLSLAYGAMIAAAVIGAVYFGLGLVLIGLSLTGTSKPHKSTQAHAVHSAPQTAAGTGTPLAQAFLHGLQAGASAERRVS